MHQKPKLPLRRINPGPHARKGMSNTQTIFNHKPTGEKGNHPAKPSGTIAAHAPKGAATGSHPAMKATGPMGTMAKKGMAGHNRQDVLNKIKPSGPGKAPIRASTKAVAVSTKKNNPKPAIATTPYVGR